jgi:hypothetical protein
VIGASIISNEAVHREVDRFTSRRLDTEVAGGRCAHDHETEARDASLDGAFHAAFLISLVGAALAFLLTAAIPGRASATLPSSLPNAETAHDGYALPGHQPLRRV